MKLSKPQQTLVDALKEGAYASVTPFGCSITRPSGAYRTFQLNTVRSLVRLGLIESVKTPPPSTTDKSWCRSRTP